MENQSYVTLTHRRTVWFVDLVFFVLLDEALGDAADTPDLHFQMGPGDVSGEASRIGRDLSDGTVWAEPDRLQYCAMFQ